MASGVEPDAKAIRNERVELTAGFVDRMAGACFAAGVVAPAAAAVFGLTGPGTSVSTLTWSLTWYALRDSRRRLPGE